MGQWQKIHLACSDGKSDKFWEIEQNDTTVQLRWGRTGTIGQSREKRFDNASEAAAFVRQQTMAKRRKGYETVVMPERPANAVWMPPPRPKHLRHGFAYGYKEKAVVKPLPVQRETALKAFQGQLRNKLLVAKGADEPEVQEIITQLQAFVVMGAEEVDLSLEMAAAALAMQGVDEQGAVAWLMLQKGLPFTVEAMLHALRYDYRYQALPGEGLKPILRQVRSEAVFAPWSHNLGQLALHHWLREEPVDSPAYQAAVVRAQALKSQLGGYGANLLTFLFSRESEWLMQAVQAWQQLPVPPKPVWGEEAPDESQLWKSGWVLWPLVPDACQSAYQDAFQNLPKNHPAKQEISTYMSTWPHWMLEYLGEGAVESLGVLVREATTADCRKNAADALKLVDTARGFREMGRCLKTKEGQRTFLPLMNDRADLSLPALLELVAECPKAMEVRRQVEHLCQSRPEVLAQLPLSASQQSALDALGAQQAPVASSAWEDLPAILRNPPWLQRHVESHAPATLMLASPLDDERIAWQEGDLQSVTPYVHEKPPLHGAKDAQTLEKIRQVEPGRLELDHLDRLSETAALEFFNALLQSPDGLTYDPVRQQKAKRFWVNLLTEWEMRCTLLRFGCKALPGLIALSWEKPADCFPVLAKMVSPRLAFTMAQGLRYPAIRHLCWQWLQLHRHETALGLLPVATGNADWAAWAQSFIRQLVEVGWGSDFQAAAAHYGEAAGMALAQLLQPSALFDLPARLPEMPDFWQAGVLHPPRLLATEQALPVEALDRLGLMLALSTPFLPYAGLHEIKRVCSADSLAAFAWSVTQLWLDHGAPGKQEWMLFGLGHLGHETVVSRLLPLIGKWPGERAHPRALLGVAVLKQMDSVSALAAIQHLSLKSRFPGLKAAARHTLIEIAAVKGLPLEGLLDQLVPDHGLDAAHQRHFVFGQQTFDIDVGSNLKVSLRDPQGQSLKNPPKGADQDATNTWKSFKKALEQTLSVQAQRLEVAMSQGQRWSAKEFQDLLQNHPVMGILAQRLVWGLWQDTEFRVAFELAEAGWMSHHDQLVQAPETGYVSVLHPVFFAPSLPVWQERFASAGIEQPFEQLQRPVFCPTPEDYVQPYPSRFRGRQVDARKLQALIRQGGWQAVYEGEIEKNVGDFRVQIVSEISVYALGEYTHCRIYDVQVMRRDMHQALPPASLPAAAFSEVLRDVTSLATV